jgi:hypothetical protein
MADRQIEQLVMQVVSTLAVLVERNVAERLREVVGGMGSRRGSPRRRVPRARRLQGQYIGLLRRLSGPTRARVQKSARESGVVAALDLAAKLGVSRRVATIRVETRRSP